MKRLCCFILAVLMVFGGLCPAAMPAVKAVSEAEDFFRLLDSSQPGLENLCSPEQTQQDFAGAKTQLLDYYRHKFQALTSITYNTQSTSAQYTLKNNILLYNETFLKSVTIRNTADFSAYTYALSASQVRSSYMLATFESAEAMVVLQSNSVLTVVYTDGTQKAYPAQQHTYIQAGEDVPHGADALLYAGHQAKGQMPFSERDARIYLDFGNVATGNVERATLSISARLSGSSDEKQTLQLLLLSHCLGKWDASKLTWSLVRNTHRFGFYSWDGVDGGIVWNEEVYGEKYQDALGVSDEFLNYNARLIQVSSLCQTGHYAAAKKALLRFVEQTYSAVESGTGFPKNRPLEPANRALEFPYIYRELLMHNALTPEENYIVLRWFYQNIRFMTDEKTGIIYKTGTADTIGSNATAYFTNWGIWHINGLYNCINYFGEFQEADRWKQIFDARLHKVFGQEATGLVFPDGSYKEVTFGYAINVLEWLSSTMHTMGEEGAYRPEGMVMSQVRGALISLVHYMLTCTYPNGILPDYGDQSGNKRLQYAIDLLLDLPGIAENLPADGTRKLEEIRWFATNGKTGQQPTTFALYPDSALVTDRTGWNGDSTMLFFNAKSGGGHAHRDALSLLLYGKGRELLVDRGTKSYEESDPSNALRTKTWVANTVSVENSFGRISQQTLGSQTTGQNGMDAVSNALSGTYYARTDTYQNIQSKDGMRADVVHKRNITFLKDLDLLLVNDSLEPQAGNTTENTYVQNWHVGNKANAESHTAKGEDNVQANTNFPEGANLYIAQGASEDGSIPKHSVRDFDSEVYGVSGGERNHILFTRSGHGNVSFNTALLTYTKDSPWDGVRLTPISTGKPDAECTLSRVQLVNRAQNAVQKELVYYNAFSENTAIKNEQYIVSEGRTLSVQAQNACYEQATDGTIHRLYMAKGQSVMVYKGLKCLAHVQTSRPVRDVTVLYNHETHEIIIETSDEGLLNGTTKLSVFFAGGRVATPKIQLNGATVHGRSLRWRLPLKTELRTLWAWLKSYLFGWIRNK